MASLAVHMLESYREKLRNLGEKIIELRTAEDVAKNLDKWLVGHNTRFFSPRKLILSNNRERISRNVQYPLFQN